MIATNAEDWIKKFDAAIAKGRGVGSETGPDRAGAIAELKALGLTDGDAEFWISRSKR